jgi:hypothetical protein
MTGNEMPKGAFQQLRFDILAFTEYTGTSGLETAALRWV